MRCRRCTGLRASEVAIGLATIEGEGFVIRGHFDPGIERRPVVRAASARPHSQLHAATVARGRSNRSRHRISCASCFAGNALHPGTQREGRAGVAATIAQLQGFEIPAGVWEETVLPSRVSGYRSAWLDELCMSGEVAWARLRVRDDPGAGLAAAKQLVGVARNPGDAGDAVGSPVVAPVGARRGAAPGADIGRDSRCPRRAPRARRAVHERHRHACAQASQ